jgi:spore coat protein U-like protein
MRRLYIVMSALLAIAICPSAYATKNCTITSASPFIDFSPYSPFSTTPRATTGTLTVRCNPNLVATVSMTQGTNSTSYAPRTMRLGAIPLAYNLYRDASANPPIWGDGTAGTQVTTLTATPQNKDFVLTVFGSMPPGGDIPPGTYTDVISVTVNDDKNGDPDTIMITVRVTVDAECTISTFVIDFGDYDPVSAHATSPRDATAVINVYCTPTTQGTVTLSAGQWSAGGTRRLRSAAGVFLDYDVFRESTHSSIWNTTNTRVATSTSRLTPLGGGFVAYGRIPANQDVPAGDYKDTLQATVNY